MLAVSTLALILLGNIAPVLAFGGGGGRRGGGSSGGSGGGSTTTSSTTTKSSDTSSSSSSSSNSSISSFSIEGGSDSNTYSEYGDGTTGTYDSRTYAVPAPATLLLLGAGFVVVAALKRRRR